MVIYAEYFNGNYSLHTHTEAFVFESLPLFTCGREEKSVFVQGKVLPLNCSLYPYIYDIVFYHVAVYTTANFSRVK